MPSPVRALVTKMSSAGFRRRACSFPQCVETTLIPLTSGEINISFGCYGCRASSDVDDSLMMMGIPVTLMDEVVRGLRELGRRAIPQSRDKVYLPPF